MSADLLGKLLALLCALIWAGAVILFKRAGEKIHPLALNLYKTALVAIILLPLFFFSSIPFLPEKNAFRKILILCGSGLLGISLADTLFFACLNRIGAAPTAIVDCFYLPSVMVASWLFLNEKPTLRQIGGALLIVTAIFIVSYRRNHGFATDKLLSGVLMGVAAMAFMAIGIVMMQPLLAQHSVFWVTEMRLLGALAGLIPLFLTLKNRRQLLLPFFTKPAGLFAFAGSISGNLISMTIWIAAFKFTSVNSAAILNQTNTIFIIILAAIFLKEKFTRRYLLATILAFGGALLVLIR